MNIVISKAAEKFLLGLDEKRYAVIMEILRFLETNPIPYNEYDLKKLGGTNKGYRIRKGKIRILYSIEQELGSIFVEKIEGRRDNTYKR